MFLSGFDEAEVSDDQYRRFFALMKEKLQFMMEDAKRKKVNFILSYSREFRVTERSNSSQVARPMDLNNKTD